MHIEFIIEITGEDSTLSISKLSKTINSKSGLIVSKANVANILKQIDIFAGEAQNKKWRTSATNQRKLGISSFEYHEFMKFS